MVAAKLGQIFQKHLLHPLVARIWFWRSDGHRAAIACMYRRPQCF